MVLLRTKEIRKMSKSEREKRLEELKMELIKARVSASKSGKSKIREIKKTIAKIHTLNSEKPLNEIEKNK